MRHTIRFTLALLVIALLPSAAFAAEEPYSGGTTPDTTVESGVEAVVAGLNVTFSIPGVSGSCDWDFGDGATAEGNPVDHTYAETGRYDVTATCGSEVFSRSVTVGSFSQTGAEVSTYLAWGGGLLLAGFVLLGVTRRSEGADA